VSTLSAEIDVLTDVDLPSSVTTDEVADLVRFALRSVGAAGPWSVTVMLTTDEQLRRLHREFMGIDEETDVMTFPYGNSHVEGEHGGDIVISVERAAEQGPEHGLTVRDEVAFLAVHGVLHLCGWDDDTPQRRRRMHQRQTEIIEAFATCGML
jgi:probable rRNA maturation factor